MIGVEAVARCGLAGPPQHKACPGRAIIKQSAADAGLVEHEGRAVVFENLEDMADRPRREGARHAGAEEHRAQGCPRADRSYRKLFLHTVTQADKGVDLDFLRMPQTSGKFSGP